MKGERTIRRTFVLLAVILTVLLLCIVAALIILVVIKPSTSENVPPDAPKCAENVDFSSANCSCSVDKIRNDRYGGRAAGNYQVRVACKDVDGLGNLTTLLQSLRSHPPDVFQLDGSKLGFLPSNLFYEVNLTDIQIRDTPLSSIAQGDGFFGIRTFLKSLALIRCELNETHEFDRIIFLTELQMLDLSYNKILHFKHEWWSNGSYLPMRSLILRGNGLETIEPNAFKNLNSLMQLDISENNLVRLDSSMLPPPNSPLKIFDASFNGISELFCDLFVDRNSLTHIHLGTNRIREMTPDVWVPVFRRIWEAKDSLTIPLFVDIIDNPLHCDCDFQWITRYTWWIRDKAYISGTCKSPLIVAGKRIADVDCDEIDKTCIHFQCNDEYPKDKGGCHLANDLYFRSYNSSATIKSDPYK